MRPKVLARVEEDSDNWALVVPGTSARVVLLLLPRVCVCAAGYCFGNECDVLGIAVIAASAHASAAAAAVVVRGSVVRPSRPVPSCPVPSRSVLSRPVPSRPVLFRSDPF